MNNKMKHYPKTYEDLSDVNKIERYVERMDSAYGSIDDLSILFSEFLVDANKVFFEMVLKNVWLEKQFVYDGQRKKARYGNGYEVDGAFSHFAKTFVGATNRLISDNQYTSVVVSYIKELYPEFLLRNPFDDSDYYAFPFNHVTLDHMAFVYQVEYRMEMLQYAEERKMTYGEFMNWAVNNVFCYNDEMGKDKYVLTHKKRTWPFLKNTTYKNSWLMDAYDFETPTHPSDEKNANKEVKGGVTPLKKIPLKYTSKQYDEKA